MNTELGILSELNLLIAEKYRRLFIDHAIPLGRHLTIESLNTISKLYCWHCYSKLKTGACSWDVQSLNTFNIDRYKPETRWTQMLKIFFGYTSTSSKKILTLFSHCSPTYSIIPIKIFKVWVHRVASLYI